MDIAYMTTLKLDGFFVGKSPLTTNDMRSFKNTTSIGSSFLIYLQLKKPTYYRQENMCRFFCWPFDRVEFLKGQWWDLSPTLSLRQNGLFEWLLCYQFMVCNQSFPTFGAYGQDFKTNKINNHCGKLYIS